MRSNKLWLSGLLPVVAVLLVLLVLRALDAMLPAVTSPAAVGELNVERIEITEEGFVAKVRANSREPMLIAQIMVDSAYWAFSQSPPGPMNRGSSAVFTINFPWVANEAHHLKFVTSVGETFEHTIDVASRTPSFSTNSLINYAVLGLVVGLLPVVLGMLCFPALPLLGKQGVEFVLAVTLGLLGYLFIDMTFDGLEIAARASDIFGGQLLVFIPLLLNSFRFSCIGRAGTFHDMPPFRCRPEASV